MRFSFNARFPVIILLSAWLAALPATLNAEDCFQSAARRTGIVASAGKPLTLLGHEVAVGDRAPDFTVVDRTMKLVHLGDFAGKVRIITVFPSIDTQVCSMQVRTFNQEAAKLDNVQILAVSVDLPFALNRFCAAEGIDKVLTLSDYQTRDFGLKYGFLIDESRLLARGTVIVDQEGTVRYVEFVKDIGDQPDYDRAVAVAKELANSPPGPKPL